MSYFVGPTIIKKTFSSVCRFLVAVELHRSALLSFLLLLLLILLLLLQLLLLLLQLLLLLLQLLLFLLQLLLF